MGVVAFACQCIVSPRGRTGNRTVTQMRHPLLVEGRPHCARQSLASALSAPRVAATSCCEPGRHAYVVTPCLLTPCLKAPNSICMRAQTQDILGNKCLRELLVILVAPYRAILQYPNMVRDPPLVLSLHRHICAIPGFATYRVTMAPKVLRYHLHQNYYITAPYFLDN